MWILGWFLSGLFEMHAEMVKNELIQNFYILTGCQIKDFKFDL